MFARLFALLTVLMFCCGVQAQVGVNKTLFGVQPDSGQIVAVDPTNGNIIGAFPAPVSLPGTDLQGLSGAESRGTLIYTDFASDSGTALYRIDPATGAVLSVEPGTGLVDSALSYDSNGPFGPAIFTIDDGAPDMWRQDGYGGPVNPHIPNVFPDFPGAMGGDDNGRHFLYGSGFMILEFNTAGAIVGSFPVPLGLVSGLAYDGFFLYASDLSGMLHTLDPNTGTLLNSVPVAGGDLTALATATTEDVGEKTVFGVQPDSGLIVSVDPLTGVITGGFPAPVSIPGTDAQGLSGAEGRGVLIYTDFTSDQGNAVYRIDPVTGAVLTVEPGTGLFDSALSYDSNGPFGPAIFTIDDGAPDMWRQDGYGGPVNPHIPNVFPDFPGAMGGDDNGRHFLYGSGGMILEFNTAGAIVGSFPVPPGVLGPIAGLAYDGVVLYASDLAGMLYTLDPNTGALMHSVPVAGGNLTALATADTGPEMFRGDCDGDNVFNGLLDALRALNFQFIPGSPAPPCLAACDADSDRVFNGLLDGIYMLNFQFIPGSPPIGPPFGCGNEPPGVNSIGQLGCNNPTCP